MLGVDPVGGWPTKHPGGLVDFGFAGRQNCQFLHCCMEVQDDVGFGKERGFTHKLFKAATVQKLTPLSLGTRTLSLTLPGVALLFCLCSFIPGEVSDCARQEMNPTSTPRARPCLGNDLSCQLPDTTVAAVDSINSPPHMISRICCEHHCQVHPGFRRSFSDLLD